MSFGCHMFTYWSSLTTSNSKRSLTQRTESRMFIYSLLQKFKLFQQTFTCNTLRFFDSSIQLKKKV
jgi:hypothetical protein